MVRIVRKDNRILNLFSSGELVIDYASWKVHASSRLKNAVLVDSNEKEGLVLVKNVKHENLKSILSPFPDPNTELSPKVYRTIKEYLSDFAVYRLFQRTQMDMLSPAGAKRSEGSDTQGEADHDINELRRIVVMFIKFKPAGEIKQKADAVAFFQLCMSLTVEALTECEGQLRQFAVDDKAENGCTALCVWGLPPRSHEVEERFALKMALKIRHGVTSMGIKINIGIAAGPAFTGKCFWAGF